MKRPDNAMMLGHPIVVAPFCFATIAIIIAAIQDPDWAIGAFAMFGVSYPFVRANATRTDYLAWKRSWDGMEEPARPRKPAGSRTWRPWAGTAMLVLLGIYFAAHADDPAFALALVWLIATGIIVGAVAVWRCRAKRVPKASQHAPVAVCISHPLMLVPSLRDAYQALPDHAKRVLGIPVRR